MTSETLAPSKKAELNPFRPTVPDAFESMAPELREYFTEQAELLRAQHNQTQAGGSTFSWDLLLRFDSRQLYPLGSLGRFVHPVYGMIHARYCKVGTVEATEYLSAPVGFELGPDSPLWTITNVIAKSSPNLVVGVTNWLTLPPKGSYVWVTQSGVALCSMKLQVATTAAKESQLVWAASGECGLGANLAGKTIGYLIETSTGEIPAAGALVILEGNSEQRVRQWIAAMTSEIQELADQLETELNSLLASGRVDTLESNVAALTSTLDRMSASIGVSNGSFARNITSLAKRITKLEQADNAALLLEIESIKQSLMATTNALTAQVTEQAAKILAMESSLAAAVGVTSYTEAEFASIRLAMETLHDRFLLITGGSGATYRQIQSQISLG